MMRKNNRGGVGEVFLRGLLYSLLIAAAVFFGIMVTKLIKQKIKDSKLDEAHNIEEVADIITAKLSEGKGDIDSVSMYVKRVSDEDLKRINEYISTLCGSVDTYRTSGNPNKGKAKVTFEIKKNTTTYVYDYLKNGTAIPSDNFDANRLYEAVKNIADSCTSPGMADYQKELRLHDYLVNHCQYSYGSPDDENEFRAYGALIDGEAVCSGYAEAMALLLTYSGVECKIVIGSSKDENHAWNLVKISGDWYHLDPTWDDPVELGIVTHAYFNLSDDQIAYDHSWNRDRTEKASSTSQNYFNVTSKICSTVSDFELTAQFGMNSPGNSFETAVSGGNAADYIQQFVNDYYFTSLKYTLIERNSYTVVIIYK
ncbi:MAG TPA: hypothetical protein DEO87_00010 [Lachnospiraceae bacterium]|nr:hypothetical protein [Lachnospiraceae bacterium]